MMSNKFDIVSPFLQQKMNQIDENDIRVIYSTFVHFVQIQIISVASTMLGVYIAFNVIDLLASGLLIAGTVKVFTIFSPS